MKHNFNENPPKKENPAQEIARIDAQLLALQRREQEILRLLSQEAALDEEVPSETEIQTAEIETKDLSVEKNGRLGEQLTQRLRQAGKTALVTAALSFGTGTTLHDSEAPLHIEKTKEPAPKEISVTSKEKVSQKDSARTVAYSPAVLEKIKDEPLIDAERIIAERIENDPSIHERAMKYIEHMDASLLNRLSTSAKIMYLKYIQDNISAVDSGMEPQYHFIIDKDYNYLTISDTKNKLVASTPVITGASFGNGLNNLGENTVDNKIVSVKNNTGKYTTPAGFWSISTGNPDSLYGEYQRRVSIEGAEQNQNIMIHPGLKHLSPLDSAKQRNAFFSNNPLDRKQSYGCIRVPHWFLRDYIHHFENGTPLGISPEKDGETEVYFDPDLAKMHKIGGEHWANSDYAAILRDIQKVQKERREAFKNKKK